MIGPDKKGEDPEYIDEPEHIRKEILKQVPGGFDSYCIVRRSVDAGTLMQPQVQGLFPCGEGAGYAGGITSSAMDGQRAARMVAKYLKTNYCRR